MSRILFSLIGAALVTSAAAQTPPAPTPNEQFLRHAVEALRMQREQASDQAAQVQANLSQTQAQIADLQKRLTEQTSAAQAEQKKLQDQIADLQKKLAAKDQH